MIGLVSRTSTHGGLPTRRRRSGDGTSRRCGEGGGGRRPPPAARPPWRRTRRTNSSPVMSHQRLPLAAGSHAPDFTLRDGPNSIVSLSDLLGRAAVLVFYVADWHPVAGDQLVQLTALQPEFERLGASVVGIAVDSPWSHAAFAAEKSISFPLLSDDAPAGQVARAFGVYSAASGRSERALFVLDPSGTVVWSGTFPDTVNPGVDAVLSALEAIGHARNQRRRALRE